jgi:hypothetical protein
MSNESERYLRMKKYLTGVLLLMTALMLFQACASKKGCNTKGKKRTEMGWM